MQLLFLWQESFGQIHFFKLEYTRWSADSILAVLNTQAVFLLLMVKEINASMTASNQYIVTILSESCGILWE